MVDALPDPHQPLAGGQIAEERAVERLGGVEHGVVDPVFGKPRRQRLDVLFQYLLREAKSVPIEGIAETDEAAGVRAALAIIEETIRTLRE